MLGSSGVNFFLKLIFLFGKLIWGRISLSRSFGRPKQLRSSRGNQNRPNSLWGCVISNLPRAVCLNGFWAGIACTILYYSIQYLLSDSMSKQTMPPQKMVNMNIPKVCFWNWLHPGRLTWNLRIHHWKRKIIFQTIISRFYVNLPGCTVCRCWSTLDQHVWHSFFN